MHDGWSRLALACAAAAMIWLAKQVTRAANALMDLALWLAKGAQWARRRGQREEG